MLEQTINDLAAKIAKKQGYKTPYQLVLKPELPLDARNKERIVIIQAGNPPLILMSRLYIEACLTEASKGKIPRLRDTLERVLEKLPLMQHTLAIVPIADAIALRSEGRKWAKTKVLEDGVVLRDEYFEVEYEVIVTDKVTKTSISRKGKDIVELEKLAKFQLSRMVLEDEELREYRDKVKAIEDAKKKPIPPNEVSISVEGEGSLTQLEY